MQEDLNILGSIGEGAFGEVSLAHSPIFGKVATKWLKPNKARGSLHAREPLRHITVDSI